MELLSRIVVPTIAAASLLSTAQVFRSGAVTVKLSGGAGAAAPDSAVPNDNRKGAGHFVKNTLHVRIDARLAGWRPDPSVDSLATIMAFAEEGARASIPGPLIRVRAGTPVTVTLSNTLAGTPLVISGLRAGSVPSDTLQLAEGAIRTVTFTPLAPGTFLYWGAVPGTLLTRRNGRDAQLTGAIVVDPASGPIDRNERIMVVTLIDVYPDTAKKQKEEIWEAAINGRSWPYTERFRYNVGDTVRWRWINGTDRSHPLHLHGFHFLVTAKGNGTADSIYTPAMSRLAVTEFTPPGGTFAMEWIPLRAGNWLMHCHMMPHIRPFPDRTETSQAHDIHDVRRHPLEAMAGLVIGITTVEARRLAFWRKSSVPLVGHGSDESLRVFIQQARGDSGKHVAKSFVVQVGAEPARDSVNVPSGPLLLTRGKTTRITIINRLTTPTSIHWHGIELVSVYDGVAGWSGNGRQVAPLIAPGDSFMVVITPPRAGTYMYHTHMDEGDQLATGIYGPIIVQEPGKTFDPSSDLVFLFGLSVNAGKLSLAVNGSPKPEVMRLQAGRAYRLRLINLLPVGHATVSLTSGQDTVSWRRIAKDGADLPPQQIFTTRHAQIVDVGEAYDYEWTPKHSMKATLTFWLGPKEQTTQPFEVVEKRRAN